MLKKNVLKLNDFFSNFNYVNIYMILFFFIRCLFCYIEKYFVFGATLKVKDEAMLKIIIK